MRSCYYCHYFYIRERSIYTNYFVAWKNSNKFNTELKNYGNEVGDLIRGSDDLEKLEQSTVAFGLIGTPLPRKFGFS